MKKDTLYYDGACPLCSAEVRKLQRFSKDSLTLKNIHNLHGEDAGLDRDALLARLHLKTSDGEWVTGLEANIRAWHHTPFRHLWRMLDWPGIRLVSRPAYEFWLRRRNRGA